LTASGGVTIGFVCPLPLVKIFFIEINVAESVESCKNFLLLSIEVFNKFKTLKVSKYFFRIEEER